MHTDKTESHFLDWASELTDFGSRCLNIKTEYMMDVNPKIWTDGLQKEHTWASGQLKLTYRTAEVYFTHTRVTKS